MGRVRGSEQVQSPLSDGWRAGAVPWDTSGRPGHSSGGANPPCPVWGSLQLSLLHSCGTVIPFPVAPGLSCSTSVCKNVPSPPPVCWGEIWAGEPQPCPPPGPGPGDEEQAEAQHVPGVPTAPSDLDLRIPRASAVPNPSTADKAQGELHTLSLPAWHCPWLWDSPGCLCLPRCLGPGWPEGC